MKRVHVICEGLTEERLVNELLREHFYQFDINLLASQIGKPGAKGGDVRYERLLVDLENRLVHDQNCYCTTLIDYYGIHPKFPGKSQSAQLQNIKGRFDCVTDCMKQFVENDLGSHASGRFIPYIQMYEFEGLLFSDPEKFAKGIYEPRLASNFTMIRNQFNSPEEINDSQATAPSKRIKSICTKYEKATYGTLGALEIGLTKIRQECKLFDQWITSLEQL